MPYSLRWIGLLLGCAAIAAPVSLYVQYEQTQQDLRSTAKALTGGDPEAGKAAIQRYRCGACHQISGVPGANGQVGPSLKGISQRAEPSGQTQNDPASLIRWIRYPQQMAPGSGMPNLGVSEKDGRDVAAYLYTLK
jgi:cytochrome c2